MAAMNSYVHIYNDDNNNNTFEVPLHSGLHVATMLL